MFALLLKKTVRDLRVSLAQAVALIVVTALGVAMFVALISAYRDLTTSYEHTYARLHFADATFDVAGMPANAVDALAALPGVRAATGRLIYDTGLEPPGGGEEIRARLIGVPAGRRPRVDDVLVEQGRYLAPGDSRDALLESHLAHVYHIEAGESTRVFVKGAPLPFRIVGIAASPEYLEVSASKQQIMPSESTFAVLFVPRRELQRLLGVGNTVNNLAVTLAPGADEARVVERITARLAPYGLRSTTLRKDQPSNAALKLDIGGYRQIAYLMPALMLLAAVASLYILLARMVRAQLFQIGVMKALGWTNRAVVGHYLAFALIVGVIGSFAGCLAGIPFADWVTLAFTRKIGIPLVQTHLYPALMAEGGGISVVAALVAALGPARASARVAPAFAMRANAASGLTEGSDAPAGRWERLPLHLRYSLRSLFRVRRRTISTIVSVVFAFGLVLMGWGLINSIDSMLRHHFHVVEAWDEMATFRTLQGEETLTHIRRIPGVMRAAPFLEQAALIESNGKRERIALTALAPGQRMHILQLGAGRDPGQALAPGRIIVTDAIMQRFGLRVGDAVTVRTATGPRRLVVGGATDELAAAAAYVALAHPVFNAVYLTVEPSRAARVVRELYAMPGVYSVERKANVERDWRSVLGLYYVYMGVILGVAIVMSFALLFNAMMVNVIERQREFATMRAIGSGGGRIARALIIENVAIWAISVLPGLALGRLLAAQVGAAFDSDLFAFRVVIGPMSYVVTAAAILVIMVLSVLPAIRRVNGLNLADATRVLAGSIRYSV